MRVLVCGGRDFKDQVSVWETLLELHPSVVITGGAEGADRLAYDWAYPVVPTEVYKADWKKHGPSAGPLRNQKMLEEGKPDVIVAFPGGRGTEDMVRRAEKAGVKIMRVPPRVSKWLDEQPTTNSRE
jgi:ABC-type Fe3+-hydroxamate transport system substrate-binding protein